MPRIEEQALLSFQEELRKEAASVPANFGRRILGTVGRAVGRVGSTLEKPDPGVLSRFAQRQLHGLSGWTPKAGLESIRGGAFEARKKLESALASGHGPSIELAQKGFNAAHQAQEAGLTNLPGYAKALQKDPVGTLKKDVAAQWHSGGRVEKALGIGLPLLGLAHDIRTPERETGPGKGELLGRGIGGAAGGFLGSSMPLAGQLLVGAATGMAGGLVGKGVDRLRGRKPSSPGQLTPPEQSQGQHVPTERVMSPAAMGQPPEGMIA